MDKFFPFLNDTRNKKPIRKDEDLFTIKKIGMEEIKKYCISKGGSANQSYLTARSLVSAPLEPRRPVARMNKADITASNDRDVEPSWRRNATTAKFDNDTFLERRKETLDPIMEALADPNSFIIGLYGSCDARKDTLLQRVSRIINRDNLFDVVVMVTVTKETKIIKIQQEIACELDLELERTCVAERAIRLSGRIKEKGKVLLIFRLRDLHKGLDLGEIGIPYGTNHPGTKIILTVTSHSQQMLTNHMHTQKNIFV